MNVLLGEIYLRTNQIDKALPLLKESIATFRGGDWGNTTIISPLLFTGEAYAKKGNYNTALKYAKEALVFAKKITPGFISLTVTNCFPESIII